MKQISFVVDQPYRKNKIFDKSDPTRIKYYKLKEIFLQNGFEKWEMFAGVRAPVTTEGRDTGHRGVVNESRQLLVFSFHLYCPSAK